MNYKVTVLGAGLAGCEAALWLAGKGVQVELYEQKPVHFPRPIKARALPSSSAPTASRPSGWIPLPAC